MSTAAVTVAHGCVTNALFVAAIRQAMRDAKVTQRQLAEAAGIPPTTLHRRLTSKTLLDIAEVCTIAEALGLSVFDLAKLAEVQA